MKDNSFICFFSNPWFLSSLISWCLAQTIKLTIDLVKTGRVDFSYYVSTGGMPSAHSALVSGLATSIGLTEGFSTPIFVLALVFAGVTMFDAAGVRQAAGKQAKILNKIVAEFQEERSLNIPRLKELLGHTRYEVFVGMLLGVFVALTLHYRNFILSKVFA